MPVFEYRGLSKEGKNVKGVIDAENQRAARLKLKKDNIYVVDIRDKKKAETGSRKTLIKTSKKTVPIRDLSLMTRQLATLIKANIPLVDALTAVAEQVENPTLAEAVSDCKNQVNEGSTFYKALGRHPNLFDTIYVSMCEAGEMSGSLDVILLRLAEFTEAQNDLRTKVKGAMTYPVIMLSVTMLLMSFLFIFVIPKMLVIFESFPNLQLPWYTLVTVQISGVLVNYWYVFLIVGALSFFTFNNWKRTPEGRKKWDAISLKIPLFGPIIQMVAVARFTRTLATLLNGGVPMLNAMQTVRSVVDNETIATAVDEARSNISEGESIAGPLRKSGRFPPIVIHMVNIGEKTGDLENMLIQVSDAFDFQVKAKIDNLTGMMGPVVLVIMGLVVAMIVFSVMIPMFELTNLSGAG